MGADPRAFKYPVPAAEADVQKALELYNKVADTSCVLHDADTVLADIMERAEFNEPGLGENVLQLWLDSKDKESFEALFELFTDEPFKTYVQKCIRETKGV